MNIGYLFVLLSSISLINAIVVSKDFHILVKFIAEFFVATASEISYLVSFLGSLLVFRNATDFWRVGLCFTILQTLPFSSNSVLVGPLGLSISFLSVNSQFPLFISFSLNTECIKGISKQTLNTVVSVVVPSRSLNFSTFYSVFNLKLFPLELFCFIH